MAMLTLATGAAKASPDAAAPVASPTHAIEIVNRALADTQLPAPDKARLLVRRGLARQVLGERNDAVSDLTDAIATRALGAEELATAFYDRGVTLDELGRTDDAMVDYSSAIE